MWALLTEILLPSPLLMHRHTSFSWLCPDHSWIVFHSNKHLGTQKHAACRKKNPFTSGCPCISLHRTNIHCVFCRGLSPSFPLPPQPCLTLQPFRCSSCISLLPATPIPPSLLSLRTLYFCLVVQCITPSLASSACSVLLYNNTVNVTLIIWKYKTPMKVPIHCTVYAQNASSFPTFCLCPVAVKKIPGMTSLLYAG